MHRSSHTCAHAWVSRHANWKLQTSVSVSHCNDADAMNQLDKKFCRCLCGCHSMSSRSQGQCTVVQVRTASTPEPVAQCILELESLLRPAALSPNWGSQAQPSPSAAGPPARKASVGRKATPKAAKAPVVASVAKSAGLNRAASAASSMPLFGKKVAKQVDLDSKTVGIVRR